MASLQEWIDGYRRAWQELDADAAAALFTEDATYRANIFEEPHRGQEGVADYWTAVTAAQSEVRVRMGRPFADGDRVTVEFWTNMQVDGDPVTLPGALLLDFAPDGRCRRLREYWHYQPGSFEPPEGWGT
ncbi:MAG: nuclear transport factor 2 family protein [Acidimicrobiia bacterium]